MKFLKLLILSIMFLSSTGLHAAKFKQGPVNIEPYYSIIRNKDKYTEASTGQTVTETRETQEYGLRASLNLGRFFQLTASYGENRSTKTEKATDIEDTFDQIDFQTDLQIDVSDPDADVTVREHQKNAKFKVVFDPSFSIFVFRAYAGMNARWRSLEREQTGLSNVTEEYGPEYDPIAGVGFGVRFNRRTYAMAEYEFMFYDYPEFEPFEQALSVSFGVNI